MSARRPQFARMLQKRAMPDTFTVSTPGAASTDAYNEQAAGSPTDVTVKGRWKTLNGTEKLVESGIAGVGDVLVELEAFQAVADNATLAVQARGAEPAHTFRVKKELPRSDEYVTQVLCTEA